MDCVYHIMVLWSNALKHKNEILQDLRNSGFVLYRMFDMHWEKESFLDDYTVFYAHSQKHLTYSSYRNLLVGKIAHCGDGDFLAIILRDDSPKFEKRMTSSGERLVNARVFDKKNKFRKLCGGGHKVHSSDDAWETNKDLTLMFGMNTEDFLQKYAQSDIIERYVHECIGVGGYDSIHQLFYVLNNTVDYVVMRNFECLPDEYTVEGHGDIDLLVESKNYVRYLTLAKPVFEEDYRVYHTISIDGKNVPFDFRFVGDNYYDKPWERAILDTREKCKNLFYVPNKVNLFYSLLYHAYIQKRVVKQDYIPKLQTLAQQIAVTYVDDVKKCVALLDDFLSVNKYEYIQPRDKSVVYNEAHITCSTYALRYGHFIKREDEEGKNGYVYKSYVYEKPDRFVKRGTKWIIDNELKFLRQLQDSEFFPHILSVEEDKLGERIELTRVPGVNFVDFFKDVNHQRKSYLITFVEQCVEILSILNEKSIVHRDFLPQNILITEKDGRCSVGLIDFGWSIEMGDKNAPKPNLLGGHYYASNNVSDLYAFGSILLEYWSDVRYVRRLARILQSETACDKRKQRVLLDQLRRKLQKSFLINDDLRLFLRRHQRPRMILNATKRNIIKFLRK